MAQFRVEYHLNEKVLQEVIDAEVSEHQEMFTDDLSHRISEAARQVIYGNFIGEGKYSPRPIGKFSSPRARYHRGWIESNYGSQRAYQSGAKKREQGQQDHKNFDHLRSVALLDAVRNHTKGNPSYNLVAGEAAKLGPHDPLSLKPGSGFDNLRGFLSSGAGQKLTRRASTAAAKQAKPVFTKSGEMRYGVQTGTLARSWRDLRVSNMPKLRFSLHPTLGSATGSPDAEKLTAFLSRNKGWKGLMDHDQLIAALQDQGIVVLNK